MTRKWSDIMAGEPSAADVIRHAIAYYDQVIRHLEAGMAPPVDANGVVFGIEAHRNAKRLLEEKLAEVLRDTP